MIPEYLKIENFFSHKYSEVNFSDFNSALLIGNTEGDYDKSNGSGKSSVFEGILWCLFNKSRVAMMDDIVRWGETTCSVSLEFKHDKKRYLVKRFRNRASSTSTVEFFVQDKLGEWDDISCSTSGDTNLKIESIISLDHKTFVNSVYFRQNDISEFAESEPSRKKEILKSIVDISRWDLYEKLAKKKARDITLECKILKKSVEEYDDIATKLEEARSAERGSRKSLKALKGRRDILSEQIDSLGKRYSKMKKSLDTDAYDDITSRITSLKRRGKEATGIVATSEAEVTTLTEDKRLADLSVNSLLDKINDRKIIEIPDGRIEDLRSQIAHFKSSKAVATETLKVLGDIDISSDKCYVCSQDIDDGLHNDLFNRHEKKVEKYRGILSESGGELLSLEEDLDKWVLVKRDNEELSGLGSKLESSSYKLGLVTDSLDKSSKELEASKLSVEGIRFELKTKTDILESIKNEDFQALRTQLSALREDKEVVDANISTEDQQIGRLSERVSLFSDQETRMKLDKKKIAKRMEKISMFDKLAKTFGRSGVQTILLDAIIEDLERSSNVILSSICNEPAVIVLETQRLGSDGTSLVETLDLKVRKDGHLQNFKSLSGGEKFRISLALRIALSDVSSRYGGSSLEFLLLDEVNSPLDRFGVETLFVSVIKSLEDKYKILVITHDESLKEKFDNVINITKINGESELEFVTR